MFIQPSVCVCVPGTDQGRWWVSAIALGLVLGGACGGSDDTVDVDRADASADSGVPEAGPGDGPDAPPIDVPPAAPDGHDVPGAPEDAAVNVGIDAGEDAVVDVGVDAGDAVVDASGHDSGHDGGHDGDAAGADVAGEHGNDAGADGAPVPDAVPGCPGDECVRRVSPQHLKLWLRGDDLESQRCEPLGTANRLAEWGDLSGNGRHARAPAGKSGPVCGPAAATINGRKTVRFPRTAGLADAEHLEVDLAFLVGRPFTLVVVERRSGDRVASYLIGARLPAEDQIDCAEDNPNNGRALLLGYERPVALVAGSWGPECGARALVPPAAARANITVLTFVPDPPPSGQGRFTIHHDGVELGTAPGPALAEVVGRIGRGYELAADLPDARYLGDLAEVAIYDEALPADARRTLESHLRQVWDTPLPQTQGGGP
jgi:hypothetical protein